LLRRQRSEQNFTSAQTFSQRLRHCIGLPQQAQIFIGKLLLENLLTSFFFIFTDSMFDSGFSFINEEFYAFGVSPQQLDALLAGGWRHFGTRFFRYNLGFYEHEIRLVIPLRINLTRFSMSKSQRRIVRKNRDLRFVIRPIEISDEKETLFERHKQRFKEGVPDSLDDFLSPDAANVPCKAKEICVYENEKLLAASFFDVGECAISSVYAMFEPTENRRSLGIYTMLLEIGYALEKQKKFYYQGYAYEGNSFYDYKKRFRGLERYDWRENWTSYTAD
jgi:arginine-tRNA-protein transferase